MRIAIASGKGGTGKTTFATNFAYALAEDGVSAAFLDCDVEEPNGHIFLRPEIGRRSEVSIPVPEVSLDQCTYCGLCSQACRFSAIVTVKKTLLTFPKLCHGCGGCALACPERAIKEAPRITGTIEEGNASNVFFVGGRLDVGEAMAPPVIRAVLQRAPAKHTVVVDVPPGTSCPTICSIKDAHVVLLVTEPTPFGLNDLRLAVEMVRALGKPFGVAVNRADVGNREVFDYCEKERIPVLFQLNDNKRIALAYSKGELAAQSMPELLPQFRGLLDKLIRLAAKWQPAPKTVVKTDRRPQVLPPTPPSSRLAIGSSTPPKELVVLSGKGGTGKTSIVASFFALAEKAAIADCDVDAADLHLVLEPEVEARWPFSGGSAAEINEESCAGCNLCLDYCRFGAITLHPDPQGASVQVDPIACEGCGVCVDACPERALHLAPSRNGEWCLSTTRNGPMVHARMAGAAENTGKLVSLVKQEARAAAMQNRRDLLLVDGSPGIGCPVIASVTGAHFVLLVTEPTLSAIHDLKRIAELCRHFAVPAGICINKADLNPDLSRELEEQASLLRLPVLGTVRYDTAVTRAQVERKSVVELDQGPAAGDIRQLWRRVSQFLSNREEGSKPTRLPASAAR